MQTGPKIFQLDFRLSIIDYVRSIGQKTRNISKNFHLPIENELRKTCVQCSKMRKNINEKVQKKMTVKTSTSKYSCFHSYHDVK